MRAIKPKGLNNIAIIVWGRKTLVLLIITLLGNCKFRKQQTPYCRNSSKIKSQNGYPWLIIKAKVKLYQTIGDQSWISVSPLLLSLFLFYFILFYYFFWFPTTFKLFGFPIFWLIVIYLMKVIKNKYQKRRRVH